MTAASMGRPEDERYRILAIDDEPEFLRGLTRLLGPAGFVVLPFGEPEPALELLSEQHSSIDAVLIDRNLAAAVDGLEVLPRAREIAPDLCHIVLTGDVSDSTAAAALRLGAFHFLTKPIEDIDAVALTLVRAAHVTRLQRRARVLAARVGAHERFERLVGGSTAMRGVYELISKIADTDLSVLIRGESGTGKELTARAIHDRSRRAGGPFVALNCGAIPETLIDSELFGHARGAFTGATDNRPGVFVEADGGTLFLDEIGELPFAVQVRLLRVLQEREVRPVGASSVRRVDVRVVAATNVDLEQAVKEQRFRADLLYRLNVVTFRLPPLRERAEDVPLLLTHLVEKHAARMRRPVPDVTPRLVRALAAQPWPGNVRELENVVQYALALSDGATLDVDVLPTHLAAVEAASGEPRAARASTPPIAAAPEGFLDKYQDRRRHVLEALDREYFTDLLERTRGNLSEAARLSGVDRSNLRRVLGRLGLHGAGGDEAR